MSRDLAEGAARCEGGDMITVPAGLRVLVATRPVDFRQGADGLVALVREALAEDPFSGTIFVFRGVGRLWTDPVVKATGARRLQVAADQRWCNAANAGPISRVDRRDGLAATACSRWEASNS